jgi:hypothetical protein
LLVTNNANNANSYLVVTTMLPLWSGSATSYIFVFVLPLGLVSLLV